MVGTRRWDFDPKSRWEVDKMTGSGTSGGRGKVETSATHLQIINNINIYGIPIFLNTTVFI